MGAHVHLKVRDVAIEMAHLLYNTMMEDNNWYDIWKKRFPTLNGKQLEKKFVDMNWPRMVGQARATLAGMLKDPTYPENMKEEIFEALTLDAQLIRGRPKLVPATQLLN